MVKSSSFVRMFYLIKQNVQEMDVPVYSFFNSEILYLVHWVKFIFSHSETSYFHYKKKTPTPTHPPSSICFFRKKNFDKPLSKKCWPITTNLKFHLIVKIHVFNFRSRNGLAMTSDTCSVRQRGQKKTNPRKCNKLKI